MSHTQSFIANGVDQEFEIPVGATITAVTVDAVAAPYTSPNPWTVRITTLPTSGQAVDITYTPSLSKALGGGGIETPLDGLPPLNNDGGLLLTDTSAGPAVVDENNVVAQLLQTGTRRQSIVVPLAGNMVSVGGMSANTTSGGSQSNVNPTFTNYFTSRQRARMTSTAAINSSAGVLFQDAEVARCTVSGIGAWVLSFDFGVNQFNADSRLLVGVVGRDGSVGSLGDPSGITSNMFALGLDAADTQLQILHNANASTPTKIPLGADFPRPTPAVDFYRLMLWASVGPSPVLGYRLQKLNDPAKIVSGTISSNLPVANALCTFSMIAGTGPTSGTAVHLDIGGVDLIADF